MTYRPSDDGSEKSIVYCSVFGIDRTPNSQHHGDVTTEALVVDAFAQLGIEARPVLGSPDRRIDLVVDPDGVNVSVEIHHRSLVSDASAQRFLAQRTASEAALLVVGNRISATARGLLTSHGAGYYDLRGRLVLRTGRLVIDAEIEPVMERAQRSRALAGKAGLEVATAVLMEPGRHMAVRELARDLGRSASTVSEVLAALRREELTDSANHVTGTDLFWAVADRWGIQHILLAQVPPSGGATLTGPLRLGLDAEHETGWALTGSAAAVAYGAPLAFHSDQTLDFFVPDQSVVRRAMTLLGAVSSPSQARATVRVAPVPSIVQKRIELDANVNEWPLAHPLFVALDLAQDLGRGREILDAWTPDDRWTRVW